jgi:hypothetical protein
MSSVFSANPRFNGPHPCPYCNAPSQWHGIDAGKRLIRVECSGKCGVYERTYTQLSDQTYGPKQPPRP